jgi:hypothetical protein
VNEQKLFNKGKVEAMGAELGEEQGYATLEEKIRIGYIN